MRIVLGYSAYTFCLGGFAFWAPQYLVYIRNMSIEQAGLWMGAITVSTGFIGTLAGGYGSNYFAKKFKGGDMWFCFWVTVIATPITFLAFSFSRPEIFLSFFVLAQLFLFASQPAVNVACITVVSPFLRSTALAFMVFMIHALGDLLSPTMVGYASRYSNLNVAVFILPFALIPCSYYYYRSYRDLS